MATLRNKPLQGNTLFFATSPRTPFKIIPEITLLNNTLAGKDWNPETQRIFYNLLRERDFFEGGASKDPALAARDRINRVPKSLGFVTLPILGLSDVGKELLTSNNKEEILLRQLLKFQLPSPYHPLGKKSARFFVKPYLEILRLIRDLDGLAFDELQIFAMQMVDYRMYDEIVNKIRNFRKGKEEAKVTRTKYCIYKENVFREESRNIYSREILAGNFHTRESKTTTEKEFLSKKIQNLRDYADAAVRNLRSTGLVNVTAIGKTLSILPERQNDVDFILSTIDRTPVYINDLENYQAYLWNPSIPKLLTDDKAKIITKLQKRFGIVPDQHLSLNSLKGILNNQIEQHKQEKIASQVAELKKYELYDDIETTFATMHNSYEPSLFFEWNTWRAMTMLNGGSIHANLKFDDNGQPMSTALGNMADIVCDYGDFDVTVEVTLSKGALQWKMEGESVPRHIGQHKVQAKKPTYCFFIAPTINPATVAHFYTLYISNIEAYGGKCLIIPLRLDTFRTMLRTAVEAPVKPTPAHIKNLFEASRNYAVSGFMNEETETVWFEKITATALNWLSI